MSNLKIGDKVNFVLGTSLLTGTITKFYGNGKECSVKTEVKIFPHILLHRVSKIEDNQLNEQNKRIKELEEKDQCIAELEEKVKELEATNNVLSKELTKDNLIKQDHLTTCCDIPIGEISELKKSKEEMVKQVCKKR